MRLSTLSALLMAVLLACTPDKDSDSDASTGTGTGTDASGTEVTSSGTTGAPLDDCAFLVDKTFASDEEHECGLGPNGPEPCTWIIAFTAETFEHQLSDYWQRGSYTCEGGKVTGTDELDAPHGGTIDAATGELVWDDIVYHPQP